MAKWWQLAAVAALGLVLGLLAGQLAASQGLQQVRAEEAALDAQSLRTREVESLRVHGVHLSTFLLMLTSIAIISSYAQSSSAAVSDFR